MSKRNSGTRHFEKSRHKQGPLKVDPDTLLKRFQLGLYDHDEAMDLLGRTDARGIIWAGEIALDKARSMSGQQATAYFRLASSHFNRVLTRRAYDGQAKFSAARAQVQLAEMPAAERLTVEQRLPTRETAKSVHKSIVSAAASLIDTYFERSPAASLHRQRMARLIDELAVMSLLNRYAITPVNGNKKPIGSETFWSFLSSIRENSPSEVGKHSASVWDISLYTAPDQVDPSLAHKIQLNRPSSASTNGLDRLTPVNILGDLALTNEDKNVSIHIIRECQSEIDHEGPRAEKISHLLNFRTGMLLQAIG